MKQLTNNGFYGVTVEGETNDLRMDRTGTLLKWIDEYGTFCNWSLRGQFDLLGKADAITEEQAAGIVEPWGDGHEGYPNYEHHDEWALHDPCLTALDSFASLLSSKGLEPETTVILSILKPIS